MTVTGRTRPAATGVAADVEALLVLSFGGPESASDVVPFLERVSAGRRIPAARLSAVADQYRQLGSVSPLNAANRDLVARLRRVAPRPWLGDRVYLGNRNSEPFVADTLAEMVDHGISRTAVFITSAFSSYSGCRQYQEDLAASPVVAREQLTPVVLPRFHDQPLLARIWADQIRAHRPGPDTELLFVTHSLPVSGSDRYVAQHLELIRTIVAHLRATGLDPDWQLTYQSRSGDPSQPWLGPDITETIRQLASGESRHTRAAGGSPIPSAPPRAVLVAPIGFCAPNMEIGWDLDHGAARAAREVGIDYHRVETPQSDDRFVDLVRALLAADRAPLCPSDCCPRPRAGRGRKEHG